MSSHPSFPLAFPKCFFSFSVPISFCFHQQLIQVSSQLFLLSLFLIFMDICSISNLPYLSLLFPVFYYTNFNLTFIALPLSYTFSSWFYCLWNLPSSSEIVNGFCFLFSVSFSLSDIVSLVLPSFKLSLGCHVYSAPLFLALTSGSPFHPSKKLLISHSFCVAVISCQFWYALCALTTGTCGNSDIL